MLRLRTHLPLFALIAAAAPVAAHPAAAQNRYDAGSFTIELPSGIRLARTSATQNPSIDSESFTGGDPEHGMVLVVHSVIKAAPADPALRTQAGVQQIMSDTARRRAALQSRPDNSPAAQHELHRVLGDTTLPGRRAMLKQTHATFVGGSRSLVLSGDTREIVTDNRVTLRSPAAMHINTNLSLVGTADASFPRRGPGEFWLVVYVTQRRTPESDAIAARMLDSFHITGAPTSVPVTTP